MVQWQLVCSNLIFSFDLVKRLYLEYMSLFKFMRSDGVLSVIGIIYALSWGCPPSSLASTIWSVRTWVKMATVLHNKIISNNNVIVVERFELNASQILSSMPWSEQQTTVSCQCVGSGIWCKVSLTRASCCRSHFYNPVSKKVLGCCAKSI